MDSRMPYGGSVTMTSNAPPPIALRARVRTSDDRQSPWMISNGGGNERASKSRTMSSRSTFPLCAISIATDRQHPPPSPVSGDGGDREVMWDAARSVAHDPANGSNTAAPCRNRATLHNAKDAMGHSGVLVTHMRVLGAYIDVLGPLATTLASSIFSSPTASPPTPLMTKSFPASALPYSFDVTSRRRDLNPSRM